MLSQLLQQIRQRMDQDPMLRDKQFQRDSFQQIYAIVSELLSNGHVATIGDGILVISRNRSLIVTIEYQIVDYLDVHDQLTHQQFPLDSSSTCPTILEARFENRKLILIPQVNHKSMKNVIYGVRCRLCDRRNGPGNISYVGMTNRSVHNRLCNEHSKSVADSIDKRANEEDSHRPMYKHAVEHYDKGDVPSGTEPKDVFRQVMDVILLPISSDDDLRSWECFWQFFFHCREFFWGWSQR